MPGRTLELVLRGAELLETACRPPISTRAPGPKLVPTTVSEMLPAGDSSRVETLVSRGPPSTYASGGEGPASFTTATSFQACSSTSGAVTSMVVGDRSNGTRSVLAPSAAVKRARVPGAKSEPVIVSVAPPA